MHKYVMFGPQGSGKGTQSRLLCQAMDFVHISIGDIFRWNMENHTKLAARVTRIMNRGELVPDDPDQRHVFHEIPDIAHDVWIDFIFRIHWSKIADSRIDVFLDGKSVFRFEGPLGYRNQIKGPYFKFGVYASGEIDTPLAVYHDNYSRGASYDDVDPGVLHTRSGDRS